MDIGESSRRLKEANPVGFVDEVAEELLVIGMRIFTTANDQSQGGVYT
jgi:hypothetical protein